MKMKFVLIFAMAFVSVQAAHAQTNVTEIAFRNSDGGDDTDPYRMRKVNGSYNNNWLELQLNDDSDESFRIYGNSCVGFGCGTYSGNLYHYFTANGNAFHSGNLGIGGNPSARIHVIDAVPSGIQSLHASTKLAIDAAGGGFSEFRNSMDNNTYSGLLFTDNNLGGYVAFRNAPDDKLHLGAYGGISFEVGSGESVGAKTERVRIDANGNMGIGTSSPSSRLNVYKQGAGSAVTIGNPDTGSGGYTSLSMGTSDDMNGYTYLNSIKASGSSYADFIINKNGGKVGIGTSSPDQLLTVNGTIHSKEVKVDLAVPVPDYVFEKDYKLPSLEEVKNYIDQNKHLPEVPSAKEMEANGVQLGEMNMLLLKKMEEMTLYMIELKSENDALKQRIEKIEAR